MHPISSEIHSLQEHFWRSIEPANNALKSTGLGLNMLVCDLLPFVFCRRWMLAATTLGAPVVFDAHADVGVSTWEQKEVRDRIQ